MHMDMSMHIRRIIMALQRVIVSVLPSPFLVRLGGLVA